MKNKHDGGFSLIEVVLAMVILALIVVPTCTSLVLSFRVNAKAEAMLQAQLAVSSAVEQLMAEGIKAEDIVTDDAVADDAVDQGNYGFEFNKDRTVKADAFPNVKITLREVDSCYEVVVTDNDNLVEVVTHIRKAGDSQ